MHPASLCSVLLACLALAGPATAAPPGAPALIENSLGMQFVRVPPGSFTMGRRESQKALARAFPAYAKDRLDGLADETPAHRVRITRGFYLGRHEVTVGQFARFLALSGHVPESVADGTGGYGYDPSHGGADAFKGRDARYSWRDPGFAQGQDHPVTNVSWNDAVAMARWLSQQEGAVYRLPTEAEWEYACRAGRRTRYQGGDAPASLLGAAASFDLDSARLWPQWQAYALPGRDGHVFTAPVGSFAPNAFGLYDMHGNVWEWTADWYGEHYYAHSPRDDPRGPDSGHVRVRRGGSWHSWSLYTRCAYRNYNSASTRYVLVGMRLLRELPVTARAD